MNRHWNRLILPGILAILVASTPSGWKTWASRPEEGQGAVSLRIVGTALAWLGVPYRLGGHGRNGVDCSGFVGAVLESAYPGGSYPGKSSAYAGFGEEARGGIRPGDILLFGAGARIAHVGIALSSDSFIHAASRGPRTGVIISSLDESSWREELVAARRIKEGRE